ncbi:hypothetical protein K502DRAFT_285583 [Neoconidiobolus thromboides FSU 785]|nr:hypothetical protein K502DRAFT_285583 [Neoconidiobolus thromboides FSU 785]
MTTRSKSKSKTTKSNNSKSKRSKPSKKKKEVIPESEDESEEEVIRPSSSRRSKPKIVEPLSEEEEEEEFMEASVSMNKNQLTRRQKAKYLDEYDEELLELKPENKKKVLSVEEAALKRYETARKRKHQSQQKQERDKLDTINRLLKKQANKKSKSDNKEVNEKVEDKVNKDCISFRIDKEGNKTLSFPEEQVGLLDRFKETPVVKEKLKCEVKDCNLPKKYCDPKTKKLSCGLEHYKLLKAV